MDYIIFRQKSKEFMRWSDGEIFVTNDEQEIKEEYEKEEKEGETPVILTINYDSYFDSMGEIHQKVEVKKGEEEIGMFTYSGLFDETDSFMDALDEWAKEYESKEKGLKKFTVRFSYHTYGKVEVYAEDEDEALEIADASDIENSELLANLQEDGNTEVEEG